ncbi:MAG: helix-turn-helix transcriptional regulator [Pseudomonadota bacterium]|nr:helix-turn-helix transcriptional regulator [Pseudomonadota bacterium]
MALKNADGQVRYGRNRYDFSSGVITAYAPGQTIEVEEEYQTGDLSGWFLLFHEDLLLKHPLKESIQQYGFFSYDIFEALHLSEREQQTVNRIVSEIDRETQQNQDEFSLDILLTNIELLLRYINRYFGRQLLTRKNFHQDSVETFWRLIDDHLDSAAQMESGLPTVNQLAEAMNMSPGYMSDMLRKQTGKSAQEHIQHRLIDKAKYRLLNTNDTVATIAYSLGFEYPQYFSRMFKKRTTMTPQEFRKRH